MFCLRQQVRSHIPWVGRPVCKHKDFAGACNGINAHMAEHGFFGKGNVNITRTYDFIHLWDALCAKRQSGDGLRTPYFVNFIHPCKVCRRQGGRVDVPFPAAGRYHNNFFHPCHLCRDNVHQDRRRVRRLAPRHIDPYLFQGSNFLPQQHPVRPAVKPTVLLLLLVGSPDIVQGFLHYLYQPRFRVLVGCFHFLLGNPHCFRP